MTLVPHRCGATVDMPGAGRQRYVFTCEREIGHGGTVHIGHLLLPGPGEAATCLHWPMHPPGPDTTDRYAHLPAATGPYRVGRKCPWNVYRQLGPQPCDDDVALFDAGRADLAALVVAALNAYQETP